MQQLRDGLVDPVPQQGEATYAAKITPDELALDWQRPALELDRLVRVGGAWTTFRSKRLKVLAAEPVAGTVGQRQVPGRLVGVEVVCGAGALRLTVVQPEGRAPMRAEAWRNGARPTPDDELGR